MKIFVRGIGAVSPAGWGVAALRDALAKGEPLPTQTMERPLWKRPRPYRAIPELKPLPAFFNHPRFRRSSPISLHAISAAQEALGGAAAKVESGQLRLGLVFCVMAGCVNYSRRFYSETLENPATASPLVFAETVFNAPASHIVALLGSTEINYTLVGDQGAYLQGLALAADWLIEGRVDGCLVIGAEEMDWLLVDAFQMFHHGTIMTAGAGALYLTAQEAGDGVELSAVTNSHSFHADQSRVCALLKMRSQLPTAKENELLCDSRQGITRLDRDEAEAWQNWRGARVSPKAILGEGVMASTAWQCVAAVDALQKGGRPAANVSVAGANQQAIGARFVRLGPL